MTNPGYVTHASLGLYPFWRERGPLLGQLDIELTERCNNDCVHCYINRAANDTDSLLRELSTERWKSILQEAASLGALSVRFTGGEPLLREDFADLYLFARRLGLKVLLYTNARLITPAIADLLARVPPLRTIEVTVYGLGADSYESVSRAPGSFAEFLGGIELLRERSIPFMVKSVLLPPNRAEVMELETWAKTIPWMEAPPAYAVVLDLRGRRDSESRNRTIRRLRVAPDEVPRFLAARNSKYRWAKNDFCRKFLGPPGVSLFDCGAGRGGCLDAFGFLQPCMGLRDPSMAINLQRGSIRDALTKEFPRLRELRATNPEYLTRCARCFLPGLCQQCPAKSWAEHGTLDTPVEYLCQVAHAEARYLGLISEGENAWDVADWKSRIAKLEECD